MIIYLFFSYRKLDVVHVSAREGKAEDLIKHLENGVSVNLRGMLILFFESTLQKYNHITINW